MSFARDFIDWMFDKDEDEVCDAAEKKLEKENHELRCRFENEKTKFEECKEALTVTTEKLLVAEEITRSLKKEAEEKNRMHEEKVRSLKLIIELQGEQAADAEIALTEERSRHEEICKEFHSRLITEEARRNELSDTLESLQVELRASKTEMVRFIDQIKELNSLNEELQKKFKSTIKQNHKLESLLDKQYEKLEIADQEAVAMRESIEILEMEVIKAHETTHELKTMNHELLVQISDLKEIVSYLGSEREALDKRLREEQKRFAKSTVDLEEKSKALESLHKKMRRLQSETEYQHEYYESKLKELRENILMKDGLLIDSEKLIEEMEVRYEEVCERLQTELHTAEQERAEVIEALIFLRRELECSEYKLDIYKEAVVGLSVENFKLHEELEKSKEYTREAEHYLGFKIKEQELMIQQSQEQLKIMTERLGFFKERYASAEYRAEMLEEVTFNLSAQVTALEAKIVELREDEKKLKHELSEAKMEKSFYVIKSLIEESMDVNLLTRTAQAYSKEQLRGFKKEDIQFLDERLLLRINQVARERLFVLEEEATNALIEIVAKGDEAFLRRISGVTHNGELRGIHASIDKYIEFVPDHCHREISRFAIDRLEANEKAMAAMSKEILETNRVGFLKTIRRVTDNSQLAIEFPKRYVDALIKSDAYIVFQNLAKQRIHELAIVHREEEKSVKDIKIPKAQYEKFIEAERKVSKTLNGFKKYIKDIEHEGAYTAACGLHEKLEMLKEETFREPYNAKSLEQFSKRALGFIEKARPLIDEYLDDVDYLEDFGKKICGHVSEIVIKVVVPEEIVVPNSGPGFFDRRNDACGPRDPRAIKPQPHPIVNPVPKPEPGPDPVPPNVRPFKKG